MQTVTSHESQRAELKLALDHEAKCYRSLEGYRHKLASLTPGCSSHLAVSRYAAHALSNYRAARDRVAELSRQVGLL